MIILSGADVVLPDRVLGPGSVVIDGDRIVDITAGAVPASPGDRHVDLHGHYIVPGFIDVHVHGVNGVDCLDGTDAVACIAADLPRYGVTAFCPTSIACSPWVLRRLLLAVRDARLAPASAAARVLPAHLESNFLNPDYCGAQPTTCLRVPRDRRDAGPTPAVVAAGASSGVPSAAPALGCRDPGETAAFTASDLLAEMDHGRADIGIVTIAPEIEGGMALVSMLRGRGHLVSLGHSGATWEQAMAAIAAGATQATHLFNRMPPLNHRQPGLAGAVLESDDVAAELVCDGLHVHPAMMRVAIAAKTPSRVMAITDGTAGSGLPPGSRVRLGSQSITVRDTAAFLDSGTLAGSVLTMDRAFAMLVGPVGLTPVDAALLCATTPARELRLGGLGVLAPGNLADIAVLDSRCRVVQTWVGGRLAFSAAGRQG
jgi:N-acetylglucosamine-6-phosphate deacetylase